MLLYIKALAKLVPVAIFLLIANIARSQTKETVVVDKLVEVLNACRKKPVHLIISVKDSSANKVVGNDTTGLQVEVYAYPEGTYIKMGNVVQVIDDSVMLYMRNNIKAMSLYMLTGDKKKITDFSGLLGVGDVKRLLKDYTLQQINQPGGEQNVSTIHLLAKNRLYVTGLPINELRLAYNMQTSVPLKITQIHRSITPLDSSAYNRLTGNVAYAGRLINVSSVEHYLLSEKYQVYTYTNLEFNKNKPLPLQISDCVFRDKNGNYSLSKQFAEYTLKTLF